MSSSLGLLADVTGRDILTGIPWRILGSSLNKRNYVATSRIPGDVDDLCVKMDPLGQVELFAVVSEVLNIFL